MNVNKISGVLHDDVISRDRDKINTTMERGRRQGTNPGEMEATIPRKSLWRLHKEGTGGKGAGRRRWEATEIGNIFAVFCTQ